MTTLGRRLSTATLALVCVTGSSRPLAAQEQQVVLRPSSDTPRTDSVWVRLRSFVPGGRRGGYGWVVVDVENRHELAHEVELTVRDSGTNGQRVSVSRKLALEQRSDRRVTLPVPGTGLAGELAIDLDGRVQSAVGIHAVPGAGVTVLTVGLGDDAQRTFATLNPFVGAAHRRAVVRVLDCECSDLPNEWAALTAFDLVVVDGANGALTAREQSVLRAYVGGGGRVIVIAPERLRPAALRELVTDQPGPFVRHGFGAIGSMPITLDAASVASRSDALRAWLTDGAFSVSPWVDDGAAGPIPTLLHRVQRVPGISGIPTNLFFLIILVFVILVGPVNHIWFHRHGRQWVVLLTVPIAGFLVTGVILGYSVLREGLGVQGVISSASLLDQRDHTVVGIASRTLFAGISPASLQPKARSYLFSGDLLIAQPGDTGMPRLAIDLENGTLDGSLVPSRRPTSLVNVASGPCRARIRFRRRADFSLELLDGDELPVVRQTDALVLHDFDGNWHTMRSDGAMRPLAEHEGIHSARFAAATLERERPGSLAAPLGPPVVRYNIAPDEWIQHRLLTHLRTAGAYVALVRKAPGFDDLGVEVEWSSETHIVVGILDPKDIID